jgi:hypothetical protein
MEGEGPPRLTNFTNPAQHTKAGRSLPVHFPSAALATGSFFSGRKSAEQLPEEATPHRRIDGSRCRHRSTQTE